MPSFAPRAQGHSPAIGRLPNIAGQAHEKTKLRNHPGRVLVDQTLASGAKIDALADMLGHSRTDTTRAYARIVDRMTENPARYLEAMLSS